MRSALADFCLAGRIARCSCGQLQPSSNSLAFFGYRGPGSGIGATTCKHCRYFEVAHGAGNSVVPGYKNQFVCQHFEPIGSFPFDEFYCGHGGWD